MGGCGEGSGDGEWHASKGERKLNGAKYQPPLFHVENFKQECNDVVQHEYG